VDVILPYRCWSRDSIATVVMGQALHHENNLNYWYLRVCAWAENKDSLFTNMNLDAYFSGGGKIFIAIIDSL
jgi:hypothetical protein